MPRIVRRLISITAVLVALPVLVVTAPLWLVIAVVADASTRLWAFPTVRLGVFAVVYLIHEWIGLTVALALTVGNLVRRPATRHQAISPFRQVQGWWAASLLRWAGRLLGVRFDLDDLDTLPTDTFIVLSRHASMVDAVLPAKIVASLLERYVHYVMKQSLQWDPNLDIYGVTLGNYFVARASDGDAEAAAIARFAEGAMPNSALIIFPEGTYATAATRARVHASLDRSGSTEIAAFARSLDHLLPPKPAGTVALLATQPEADVVVLGHVGLEGVAQLAGLRTRLPLERPIVARWWVHPRSTVPSDPDGQVGWLNDQWLTLDRWVDAQQSP
ncbi:MAG: 1-acyl-sn-glycerol-3-phosphate acyltransferase [Actinomycetota bacterium]